MKYFCFSHNGHPINGIPRKVLHFQKGWFQAIELPNGEIILTGSLNYLGTIQGFIKSQKCSLKEWNKLLEYKINSNS